MPTVANRCKLDDFQCHNTVHGPWFGISDELAFCSVGICTLWEALVLECLSIGDPILLFLKIGGTQGV